MFIKRNNRLVLCLLQLLCIMSFDIYVVALFVVLQAVALHSMQIIFHVDFQFLKLNRKTFSSDNENVMKHKI